MSNVEMEHADGGDVHRLCTMPDARSSSRANVPSSLNLNLPNDPPKNPHRTPQPVTHTKQNSPHCSGSCPGSQTRLCIWNLLYYNQLSLYHILCRYLFTRWCGALLLLAHYGPTPATGVNIIKLGVILPHVGRYPWIVNNTVPGIRFAVDYVHNRSDLLVNHELQVHIGDSQCSETFGPLVAIDMYLKKMAHVFLGPACDYSVAPIARFSPHWNIPVISAGALVQAFQNKEEYAQLTRISGSYAKLGSFISQMFDELDWSISGLIYNDYAESSRSDCFFAMEAVYHSVRETLQKRHNNRDIWYKSFDERSNPPTYNLTEILTDGSKETRSKQLLYA